jgi:Uncharacterized protein conserved in bacteria (DUF2332)
VEAHGRSPLYERWALEIAGDESTLEFLSAFPRAQQQPNLLFAAVRFLCGMPRDWNHFRTSLLVNHRTIREVMMRRRAQTNEPARCATLLPLLALLPQPLALLEIGASAGLCLLPDLYAYEYNDMVHISPTAGAGVASPTFSCMTNAHIPLPVRNLDVVWRRGLDLEPLRVHDRNDVAWLEALVWPGEQDRGDRLRQALDVARRNPPSVTRGDMRFDLTSVAAVAPPEATLVIFHTAVLAYAAAREERTDLAKAIARIRAIWISNEVPAFSPCDDEQVKAECPVGQFLLAENKRPIAYTDPHGRSHSLAGEARLITVIDEESPITFKAPPRLFCPVILRAPR